jgi:hypothetical protein
MKHWIFGLIAFFLTLGIGVSAAWLFFLNQYEIEPTTDGLSSRKITVSDTGLTNDSTPTRFSFASEFTNVELDEEVAKTSMNLELVSEGQVALCTDDPKKAERKWFGFFKRGEEFSLERRSVNFGPADSTDFGSFSSMSFRGSKDALFLLSDQGTLTPGPATTLYLKAKPTDNRLYVDDMQAGYKREFMLNGTDYVLRVAPATLESGDFSSVLLIEQGSNTQIIWYKTFFGSEGDVGELEWVGDLDGDDRLDLQISYFAQNGGQLESLLFLSSFAKKERLVGFAGFYSARCQA